MLLIRKEFQGYHFRKFHKITNHTICSNYIIPHHRDCMEGKNKQNQNLTSYRPQPHIFLKSYVSPINYVHICYAQEISPNNGLWTVQHQVIMSAITDILSNEFSRTVIFESKCTVFLSWKAICAMSTIICLPFWVGANELSGYDWCLFTVGRQKVLTYWCWPLFHYEWPAARNIYISYS